MPKISVIMACYNEESCVNRAIESILDQSFTDFDFIIVDDGSTDRTRELIKTHQKKDNRIKLIVNEKNIGLAASLNKGISMSSSEYIARMDADDFSFSDRLRIQLEYLKSHPEVDVLGSNAEMVMGGESWLSKVANDHASIAKLALTQTTLIHPTVCIKRTCFDNDGYDNSLPWAEDKDLWFRWFRKYTFANMEDVLLRYKVKPRINRKILYYNNLVLYRHLVRNNALASHFHVLIKSILSHIYKLFFR